MTLEEQGAYRLLLDFQWSLGKLPSKLEPNFDKTMASMLGCSTRKFRRIWKAIGFCFEPCEDDPGHMVNPSLERIRRYQEEISEKRSMAGRMGGRPKAKVKQTESKPKANSKANEKPLIPSSDSLPPGSSNPSEERGDSLRSSPSRERPKDVAYEIFADKFENSRHVPYQERKADFVQLAKLRKSLDLEARTAPSGWPDAVHNYLDSPLAKYTLADLCARFDIFMKSQVDRYGRPSAGGRNGRETAEERSRRNFEAAERHIRGETR